MIRISKSAPPTKLVTYKNQVGASYKDRDKKVDDQLRDQLVLDQYNICAYCERILPKDFFIEHHCEQTICNGDNGTSDLSLVYGNMFAVCKGNSNNSDELTCDKHKAKHSVRKLLPMKFNPTNQAHCNSIKYKRNGVIESSLADINTELNTILNLNQKTLVKDRKRKYMSIINACLKKGKLDSKRMSKIILDELVLNPYKLDFPGLSHFIHSKYVSR